MKKLFLITAVLSVALIACHKKDHCGEHHKHHKNHGDKDWGKKDWDKDNGYQKVVVEDVVISDECDCMVSGIIEYYEGGTLTATVDYGDGTCDEVATKTTEDGTVYTFNPCEDDKGDWGDKKDCDWKHKKHYDKKDCDPKPGFKDEDK